MGPSSLSLIRGKREVPAASMLVAPSDSAFARDVMQLDVQAVHRVVCLVD